MVCITHVYSGRGIHGPCSWAQHMLLLSQQQCCAACHTIRVHSCPVLPHHTNDHNVNPGCWSCISCRHSHVDDQSDDEDQDCCRICRSSAAPLFYPCKCSGSIKYVHQQCLMDWLGHSGNTHCEVRQQLEQSSSPTAVPCRCGR